MFLGIPSSERVCPFSGFPSVISNCLPHPSSSEMNELALFLPLSSCCGIDYCLHGVWDYGRCITISRLQGTLMGKMATTVQKCFYFILHIQTEAYCMLADISNCLYKLSLLALTMVSNTLEWLFRCMAWFSSSRWTFLQYVSHFGIPSSERVCLFSGRPTGKRENMIWDAD